MICGNNTLSLHFKNTKTFGKELINIFSQISVQLIQYFIGFHAIIYFSGNEELPSLCVKKAQYKLSEKSRIYSTLGGE